MRTAPTRTASWLVPLLLVAALGACGPKSLKERTRHGEELTDEASTELDAAERALGKLEPDAAKEHLKEAREMLSHPNVELSAESEMQRERLKELEARVAPAREERARRELEAAVEKQRDSLMRAMDKVSTALEALERKEAGRSQVEAVLTAAEDAREQVREGKSLEARSEDYAASVRRTEQRLEQAVAKAQSTQQRLDFVAGPAADRQEAEALVKQAKAEKDPDKQLTLYTSARDRFQRCGETAKQLISKAPQLERSSIQVDGQATTPKAVISGCATKAGSLEKTVKKLEKAKAARDKKRAAAASKPPSKSKGR
ncbi:MAG: hypothetical protein JXB05_23530 [Myxococcaceae bacterium]|nr:hypothetical protein [Myxococcaceae bacterium]